MVKDWFSQLSHTTRGWMWVGCGALLFFGVTVPWLVESAPFEGLEFVNIVFVVGPTTVPFVYLARAEFRGGYRSEKRRFVEDGYLGSSMSRSKPSVIFLVLWFFFTLMLAPMGLALVWNFDQLLDAGLAGVLVVAVMMIPSLLIPLGFIHLLTRLWVDRRIWRMTVGLEEHTAELASPQAVDGGRECSFITRVADAVRSKSPATDDANVVGKPPLRLLYLWNFDSGNPQQEIDSWRRYGPVYWLWGPNNIPLSTYFELASMRDPTSYFSSDDADVDRWLRDSSTSPVRSAFGGRGKYPAHSIACLSTIWRSAVAQACASVDVVVLDARGYTAERDGLTWELEHVAASKAVDRFLVLADSCTDVRHLTKVLESAGAPPHDAASGSAGSIRIVYPPLLGDRQYVEALFDEGELPTLEYRADNLAYLFYDDEWERGERLEVPPPQTDADARQAAV